MASLIVVSWAMITGTGNQTPARVFGGVEFLLSGVVIMIGGSADLLTSEVPGRPNARKIVLAAAAVFMLPCVGYSQRLSALSGYTPSGTLVTVTVLLFILTVACGTYAVWLSASG
ncbi:hypothetical protein [Streptomyces sp. NPDC000229]|uniref:hypothetical protein n=1 Tax=Streptomyces sp. NPDC000229 TaxID=3154247 RepID=UPI003316BB00